MPQGTPKIQNPQRGGHWKCLLPFLLPTTPPPPPHLRPCLLLLYFQSLLQSQQPPRSPSDTPGTSWPQGLCTGCSLGPESSVPGGRGVLLLRALGCLLSCTLQRGLCVPACPQLKTLFPLSCSSFVFFLKTHSLSSFFLSFICLCWVLVLARGIFTVSWEIFSCEAWTLVLAHGLSCPAACGTLVP